MKQPQLINRYTWYEIIGIYAGILVFLTFVLAPFVEGFLVSLKPLSQLFSSPYRFIPENGSFEAYRTMWISVPGFARYIFNSFFISTIVTAVVLVLVIPASYAFARFEFKGAGMLLGAFLAVNMFSGAVLLIPVPVDAHARTAQHLFRHHGPGRCLPDPVGDLAAAHLHDAHSEGA
jgi:multiple sugar transport system permease protein